MLASGSRMSRGQLRCPTGRSGCLGPPAVTIVGAVSRWRGERPAGRKRRAGGLLDGARQATRDGPRLLPAAKPAAVIASTAAAAATTSTVLGSKAEPWD